MVVCAVRVALVVVAVVCCGVSGCTALILVDDAKAAGCDDDADCPAAEVCDEGTCVAVIADGVPGEEQLIGAAGGRLFGPDGLVLDIEPGAVDGAFAFAFARASATLDVDNVDARGAFYEVRPTLRFNDGAGARLSLPDCLGCAVFLRPAEGGATWERLDDDAAAVGFDVVLRRTNVFVAGVPVDDDGAGEGEGEGEAEGEGDDP